MFPPLMYIADPFLRAFLRLTIPGAYHFPTYHSQRQRLDFITALIRRFESESESYSLHSSFLAGALNQEFPSPLASLSVSPLNPNQTNQTKGNVRVKWRVIRGLCLEPLSLPKFCLSPSLTCRDHEMESNQTLHFADLSVTTFGCSHSGCKLDLMQSIYLLMYCLTPVTRTGRTLQMKKLRHPAAWLGRLGSPSQGCLQTRLHSCLLALHVTDSIYHEA